MINVTLFSSVAFIYLIASLFYFCYLFFRKQKIGKAGTSITVLALIVHTIAYGVRWLESYQLGIGHSPLSFFTLYETIIFTCWSMALIYLILEHTYQVKVLGAFVVPLISLGMLYASLSPEITGDIEVLPSVLQGNFLAYHVVSCIMSLVAFLFSLVVSILILMTHSASPSTSLCQKLFNQLPSLKVLDELSYKTIAIGFILFSIGMATGAYRTKIIWGSYWSWDPVETSALIIWLIYALILHGRYQHWWGLKLSSVLSILAFCISILCFLIAASYIMVSGHYPIL
jgi:cytochrome c-type biogenesis protein CcsB